MYNFKKVLETVFIKDYRTTALILEGGEIYVYWKLGQCYNKDETVNGDVSNYGNFQLRLDVFDKLEKYYLKKYEK